MTTPAASNCAQILDKKISLRGCPLCPYGDLEWRQYYWAYPRKEPEYEEDYWGQAVDPDGRSRNLVEEWDQQVRNLAYITDVLAQMRPGSILDVGCGPGFLLSAVDKAWERYGVDVSKKALDYCARYANVSCGDLPSLRFPDGKFDVIVMNHVIEHLGAPLEYIAEARRILRREGLFIVATPDFDSGCARRFRSRFRMLHDSGHVSLFTAFSLVKMLEDYGFSMIHVEYPFFETAYFTKENMLRMFDTTSVSPPFYGNHVVVFCRNSCRIDEQSRAKEIHETGR
jgi:SAM-dependent methyltransferase